MQELAPNSRVKVTFPQRASRFTALPSLSISSLKHLWFRFRTVHRGVFMSGQTPWLKASSMLEGSRVRPPLQSKRVQNYLLKLGKKTYNMFHLDKKLIYRFDISTTSQGVKTTINLLCLTKESFIRNSNFSGCANETDILLQKRKKKFSLQRVKFQIQNLKRTSKQSHLPKCIKCFVIPQRQ